MHLAIAANTYVAYSYSQMIIIVTVSSCTTVADYFYLHFKANRFDRDDCMVDI